VGSLFFTPFILRNRCDKIKEKFLWGGFCFGEFI